MDLQPAVFLDRDGTINEEVEYLSDPDQLRLIPGAAGGLRLLNRAGIPVIIVTNQSGVGRGFFTRESVEAIHERLRGELAARGAHLDGIYDCPHHPDDFCPCRKPKPGLLIQAAREHRINLVGSVMVGDKPSDLEAGRRAGCRTVLVRTGYGAGPRGSPSGSDREPDHLATDLLDAAIWVLNHRDGPRPPRVVPDRLGIKHVRHCDS